MKGIILLNHNENTRQVEEEEKQRFLHSLLEQMGVPIDFWETGGSLTIEQRMQLRKIFSAYGIQVIDDKETMDIYVDGQKVGSWNKPYYVLKKDLSQLDPKKQLFLEMTCEIWSLFEEAENKIEP